MNGCNANKSCIRALLICVGRLGRVKFSKELSKLEWNLNFGKVLEVACDWLLLLELLYIGWNIWAPNVFIK